ncbi:Ras-related protein Rab7 [Hibiscus syriacus]|uniref:Ras-related protein Rab7 n=2 Tax=Magnoliopsida TaxID=3398 RepID=A0A6A2XHD2_HIBSY|nr:Ras-related protein Rab7 [Hibiscus syriacus]
MSMRRRTLLKVIVLGDSGMFVFNFRYVHKKFSQQYKATIGADLSLRNRLMIALSLCRLLCPSYDVNVMKSFDTLDNWHDEFLKQRYTLTTDVHKFSYLSLIGMASEFSKGLQANPTDPRTFPFALLGNKIDVDGGNSRVVSEKKAKDWCASKGTCITLKHQQKNINVDAAFLCIAKNALANEREQDIYFQGIPEAVTETEQSGVASVKERAFRCHMGSCFSQKLKNLKSLRLISPLLSIAALDDAFLKDYTLAEEYAQKFHLPGSQFYTSLSRHQMDFETEEVEHCMRVEVPDMAGLVNRTDQEANREKYNDRLLSEEHVNLHTEAEKILHFPLNLNHLLKIKLAGDDEGSRPFRIRKRKNASTSREMMKGPDHLESENEMNQAMEEDNESVLEASAEFPDISGSASMENAVIDQRNRETMKELNLLKSENEVHPVLHEDRVEEKSPGLIKPFGEEETNRDMKSSYRVQPENEVHHVMVEDHKLGKVRRSSSLQVEGFFHLDIQEPSPLVRPLAEEIHTDAEHGKLPATRTSKYGNVRLLLKWYKEILNGTTTPHFMLIPSPSRRNILGFLGRENHNEAMDKDASDLVSKRVKDGRTALGAMKTRWIPNLPQSFSEPSLPCILELKSVYCGKRLRHLESINITKHMDSPEPPAVSGFIEQANYSSDC